MRSGIKRLLVIGGTALLIVALLFAFLPWTTVKVNEGVVSISLEQNIAKAQSSKTPIFISGAEAGIITVGAAGLTPVWNALGLTAPTVSTTTYHYGLRSYRFNVSSDTGFLKKTISSTRLVGTVAVYFASSLPNQAVTLIQGNNARGNFIIRYQTSGTKLQALIGAGTAVDSAAISPDTWYVIDFDFNAEGATAYLDWRVDGSAQTQASNVQASASITAFIMGTSGMNSTTDVFYDDLILSYTAADYPLGSGADDGYSVKVLGFSPDSDGTHDFTADDFIRNAAGGSFLLADTDGYTYIDERPLNGGDFINNAVSRASNTKYMQFAFEDSAETSDAIGLEVVSAQHSAATQANNAALTLNDNSTISDVYALTDISQTALIFHSKQFATAPSTGTAWTQTRINALMVRFGYSIDAAPDAYLDGTILEVAYPVVTGGTPEITVSPTSYDFGVVTESSTPYTTTSYFTVDNTSTIQTDQTIGVTTSSWGGGVTWTHSDTATPGSNTVGLKANKGGTWGIGDVIVKYSTPNYIAENQAATTDYSFGLKMWAPTAFTDGVQKAITVKVSAAAG